MSRKKKKSPAPDAATLKRVSILRWINAGMAFASFLLNILEIFWRLPDKLYSALTLLLFFLILGFCVCFRKDADFSFKKSQTAAKVDVALPLVISALLTYMRCSYQFSFINGLEIAVWSLALGICLAVLLFILLKNICYRFSHVLTVFFCCLGIAFSSLCCANVLLDSQAPTESLCQIQEKRHTVGKGATQYVTVILAEGQEVDIRISHSLYESLENKDSITVITHHGGLGFAYVTAE